MTMPAFRISQTGKILIGVLLAAAAIFLWFNIFLQNRAETATVPSARDGAARSATIPTPAATAPGIADPATAANAAPGTSASSAADPAVPSPDGAVAVEVAPPLEVTTRDLVVSDLPFLVTEPSADPDAAAAPEGDAQAATGADRPESAQRATINPFSPVVIQGAGTARAAVPAAEPTPEPVVEVAVPSAPEPATVSTPEPVVAPAPAALAPPSPRAQGLPRALPAGTLPSTPDILRSARTAPEPLSVSEVIGATGVREPGSVPAPELAAVEEAGNPGDDTATAELAPLGPAGQRSAAEPAAADPLAAGVTPLSAFLRDNNVTFTGSVLGPVSVGVFRSALSRNPIVIALGSTLPDTDIVLTDLRGQQAQFAQDEATQILTLNLRR